MSIGLGQGVYSVREASALTGVSSRRVRRWFKGYEFASKTGKHSMPPVVTVESREVDGQLQLSFLDLIEIRLIDKFVTCGVGWRELRSAAVKGAQLLKSPHPFASLKFRSDGRRMFADLQSADGHSDIVQLRDSQQFFKSIISPVLLDVEFDATQAIRWWPLGKKREIFIDPKIGFGKPVTAHSGVPVEILGAYAKRYGVIAASNWYRVRPTEAKDAVVFVNKLAA